MRLDPVQIAFPLGTYDGLMVDLEPPADGFKRVRGISPATVRHEGRRSAIPDARCIEDHQCGPRRFRWGHSASPFNMCCEVATSRLYAVGLTNCRKASGANMTVMRRRSGCSSSNSDIERGAPMPLQVLGQAKGRLY